MTLRKTSPSLPNDDFGNINSNGIHDVSAWIYHRRCPWLWQSLCRCSRPSTTTLPATICICWRLYTTQRRSYSRLRRLRRLCLAPTSTSLPDDVDIDVSAIDDIHRRLSLCLLPTSLCSLPDDSRCLCYSQFDRPSLFCLYCCLFEDVMTKKIMGKGLESGDLYTLHTPLSWAVACSC